MWYSMLHWTRAVYTNAESVRLPLGGFWQGASQRWCLFGLPSGTIRLRMVTCEEAGGVLQTQKRGKRRKWASLSVGEDQYYSVDAVVRILAMEPEEGWTPSRDTVYDWIKKGHRWYGKIDVIRDSRGRPHVTDQGLAQVRMIVQAENRHQRLLKQARSSHSFKQLLRRKKNPDGTPDWEAIEVSIARSSNKAEAEDVMPIEEQIDVCRAWLVNVDPGSDQGIALRDKLQELQKLQHGAHP